ncbi:DNA repair protein RecO (recombination protein O) [Methylohalomonas lacus]|uniref:DNA repair protein RecO n=1 Tax=Methylohalomonas lacus TaxID=398773 RepID=A0AAE3L144_9GAMM|nr:DNA repair protein RecO [Methylohalomonas lacus]MCS3902621.1 DNA repair protein RecO (recombination protein O) [Methylohalomonas lacus]
MRVEPHSCFVLHTRAYRETSLLIEIFSQLHGRVGLVGRGSRRRQSGQAALVQPFRRLSIAWSARGELGTLVSVDAEAAPVALTGAGLMAGFYVNELIMRLLHRDEAHTKLFDDYAEVMLQLAQVTSHEQALRLFEIRLLEAVGYGLILDHDIVTGTAVRPDELYQYISEQGPSLAAEHMPKGVCIHGSTLIELAVQSLQSEQSLREAKLLLRQELGRHLGDRPLASRSLYQAYLQQNRSLQKP